MQVKLLGAGLLPVDAAWPLKPKVTDWFGPSVPFHDTLVAVTLEPLCVIDELQNSAIVWPAGQVQPTCQPVIVDWLVLVTVTVPVNPELPPQSDAL